MPRLVLVLPHASYRAAELLAAARRLGADVVVACDRRQAFAASRPGTFLEVDLEDPGRAAERIASAVADADGVLSVDDQGLLTAALAGELLGVRHSEPGAVQVTRDKAAMRRLLAAAGVPQPRWAEVRPGGGAAAAAPGAGGTGAAGRDDLAHRGGALCEPRRVALAAAALGFPVVVKPPSLSGSRGVIRADDEAAAEAAALRCRAILQAAGEPATHPLLVESFVGGAELALEGLLRDGELEVLAVFDKPDALDGPFFEETIYLTPSRLPASVQARASEVVAGACAAIGLSEGPVHAEARVDVAGTAGPAGDVVVLEVAARTIGGRCAKALRFATGASLDELVVARALRLDAARLPELEGGAAGVLMIPIPASGRLAGVGGLDRARAIEGVSGLELTIPTGAPVLALPEGDRYLGFVFARGDSPEQVEATLRAAQGSIEVRVEPLGERAAVAASPGAVASAGSR